MTGSKQQSGSRITCLEKGLQGVGPILAAEAVTCEVVSLSTRHNVPHVDTYTGAHQTSRLLVCRSCWLCAQRNPPRGLVADEAKLLFPLIKRM